MGKRFVIDEQCERPEFDEDSRGLCVVDTLTDSVVGCDGGELEDQSLGRDWHWVVEALNAMDAAHQAERATLLERAISAEAKCDCDSLRAELARRDTDVRMEVRLEHGTRIHQAQQEAQSLRAEVARLRAELFRVTGAPIEAAAHRGAE